MVEDDTNGLVLYRRVAPPQLVLNLPRGPLVPEGQDRPVEQVVNRSTYDHPDNFEEGYRQHDAGDSPRNDQLHSYSSGLNPVAPVIRLARRLGRSIRWTR